MEVISFFVTARFAGQADRAAFTDVVLEQLASLLDADLPVFLTPANREAHLLKMLEEAAEACQGRRERLILVVDGLDEDTGVTVGHDSYSIAALLPPEPPRGLRVIVASRPNPPVPADVPAGHPLQDLTIQRVLSPAPQAQVIREDAERGLRRLLSGSSLEHDMLGLVTAAGGGLSCADLAELTGATEAQVRSQMYSVTGRMFASRQGHWQPNSAPEVFVLAHEELQAAASASLGRERLARYRDKLKAWAGEYRGRSWPEGTPEYLLRGYFRMLQASCDVAELLACARDRARHDRMLDISKGDAAGLAEIAAAQELTAGQPPDFTTLALLAQYREDRTRRNDSLPDDLPALWAALGEPGRAEALARSMTDTRALAGVAEALAKAGQQARAIELATEADANGFSDLWGSAISWVTEALAVRGLHEEAEAAALSATDLGSRAQAFSRLAMAMAAAGEHRRAAVAAERAETSARSIADPAGRTGIMTSVADALAAAGEHGRAHAFALSIPDMHPRDGILANLATALAAAGQHAQAAEVTRQITTASSQKYALLRITQALAEAGEYRRAEDMAESLAEPEDQANALAHVATVLAEAGQPARAAEMAGQAEIAARSSASQYGQDQALGRIAGALAAAGELARAEAVISSITQPGLRADGMSNVAAKLYSGKHPRASALAAGALAAATSEEWETIRESALRNIARVMAQVGQYAHAETALRSSTYLSVEGLTELASDLAEAGLESRAADMAAEAERLGRSLASPPEVHAELLAKTAMALAQAGHYSNARHIAAKAQAAADSVIDPGWRSQAFIDLAKLLCMLGSKAGAEAAVTQAEAATLSHPEPWKHQGGLEWIAAELAPVWPERALAIVQRISGIDDHRLAEIYALAARAVAADGDSKRARKLADQSHAAARSISSPRSRGSALIYAISAMLATKQPSQAVVAARSIVDADQRAQALANVAAAAADSGQHKDAAETISEAHASARSAKPAGAALPLVVVARAMAAGGEYDNAIRLARSISSPSTRAWAFVAVARAAVAARRKDEAADAAELAVSAASTSEMLTSAMVLGQAAIIFYSIGDVERCTNMTAQIIISGNWQEALPALARLEPSALISMAAEVHQMATQASE